MTYNIHPIIVHFPIALLFLYSVIKILPFKKFFPKVAWRDIERVLLFFGVLGAFAALATGGQAKHVFMPNRDIVNAHSTFAIISVWLYGALLAGEIFAMLNVCHIPKLQIAWLTKLGICIEKIFCNPIFSKIIALVAIVALTITGMLGGVMVYGLTADPMAPHVLKLLNLPLPQ